MRVTDQTAPERKSVIGSSFIQDEYSSATLGNLFCGAPEVIERPDASREEDVIIAEEKSSLIVEVPKQPENMVTPKPVKKWVRKSKETKNIEENEDETKEKSEENSELKGKDDEP
jgi:hypothetical protein